MLEKYLIISAFLPLSNLVIRECLPIMNRVPNPNQELHSSEQANNQNQRKNKSMFNITCHSSGQVNVTRHEKAQREKEND